MLFFQNWTEIARIAVTAVVMYVVCVALVSLFGKRASAKMNNFDWIVTIAMGAILGSSVLLKKVVILEVTVGLFVLLLLQFLFTYCSVRFGFFKKVMKKTPTLLYFNNEYFRDNLNKKRITVEEVQAGIRKNGYLNEKAIEAVIIEPDGSLSVLAKSKESDQMTREDWEALCKNNGK